MSAYRLGMSVILIHKSLEELNYDSTITKIHEALWSFNVYPDNFNCSKDSLIWRRYLIYMIEKFNVSTLEEFEELALQEAMDYYNIDKTTFTKYWNDYNEFTQEMTSPLDPDWVFRACHYFGFTIKGLSIKVIKNNIIFTPNEIYDLYTSKAETHTFTNEDLTLIPNPLKERDADLKEFWRLSHVIGKDVYTIVKWTEVFTGTSTTTWEIQHHIEYTFV